MIAESVESPTRLLSSWRGSMLTLPLSSPKAHHSPAPPLGNFLFSFIQKRPRASSIPGTVLGPGATTVSNVVTAPPPGATG